MANDRYEHGDVVVEIGRPERFIVIYGPGAFEACSDSYYVEPVMSGGRRMGVGEPVNSSRTENWIKVGKWMFHKHGSGREVDDDGEG